MQADNIDAAAAPASKVIVWRRAGSIGGMAGAGGVKVEGPVRTYLDDIAGFQRGMGIGHGDKIVVEVGQVQAGLVAQMFDPFHQTVLPLTLTDLFGAQADLDGTRWRWPERRR